MGILDSPEEVPSTLRNDGSRRWLYPRRRAKAGSATGIDIRDGLQMECIACTQCIDACDPIMDRLDLRRGLTRYTSERALEGQTTRVLRGRTVAYGLLLAIS